jgi:hypothetical protein
MPTGQIVPATIRDLTTGAVVTCDFRPKELALGREIEWTPGKAVGRTMDKPKYTKGSPMKLQLELLFDNYEEMGSRDIRGKTKALWAMTYVTAQRKENNTQKGEPPHVEFRCGTMWSFRAVITAISEKFTMFDPDGTPVRSTVTLSLLQAEPSGDYPGQNPTSGGRDGYAVHQVIEGETIDIIAFQEYGSATAWRHLAEVNNLDDPSRLAPGQRLLFVPLPV